MLGSLFEEEEGDGEWDGGGGGDTATTSSTGQKPRAPPPPRPSVGLSGIINQGATCYLNALLQTLALTPEFRESLFSVGQNELGNLEDKDKPGAKVRVIPIQLQKLIARLLLKDVHAVSSADLTDSFGWTNREETEQHDVQELNRILFSAVESSLAGTSGEKFIRNLYHGTIVNQIICEECRTISNREEDFLDLCVTVSGSSGLEDSLTYSFVNEELLTDANKYQCSRCSKLTNAIKRARLRLLPPILTVSLLRFNFDFVKMERFKEVGKFTFPMNLDMSKFIENDSCTDGSTEYELFSVLIHRGSTHGGHYHAYIRDIDSTGSWTHPDMEEIHLVPSSAGEAPLDVIECNSCQSVLKSILERTKHGSGMTIDSLCGELVRQTGVSWNKRFKKQHGPITKFLKSHSDLFEYNADANWVSLKVVPNVQRDSADDHGDGLSSSQQRNRSNRSASPVPEPGCKWFDFDDIHVRPIRLKDIEAQFAGKECAYMLFYRSRSLVRPPEASGNPAFGVPDVIVADIAKENADLNQQRFVFQSQLDMISLQVHFSSSYFFSSGSLHPCDGSSPFVELSISRQKTVSDLLFAIADSVPPNHIGENNVIHTAKETPAGLHLYENLTDNLTATLASCDVQNSGKVFLWDGRQVGGQCPNTGHDSEPILLNILCSNGCQFNSGFPRNMTAKDLKEAIGLHSGIPSRNLTLSLLVDADSNESSAASASSVFENEEKSLAKLGLGNFSQLYASDDSGISDFSASQVKVKSADAKKLVTLTIENHCLVSENSDTELQTVSVQVDQETSVAELKTVVLSQLALPLDDLSLTRLRMYDDGFGMHPPLYEHEAITAAGLNNESRLLLEMGAPLLPNQVMLFLSVRKSSKVSASLELVAEKAMTIGELLLLAVASVGLESSDYHLSRLNWNGDPAGILDDTELTIEQCQIGHGDHLSLESGRLPPKGFLQLSIYLYPNTVSSNHLQPGYLQQLYLKFQEFLTIQNDVEDKDLVNNPNQADYKLIGTICISKLSTLLDLKDQIRTLDEISAFSIPSAKFLRLRSLRSKRLGHVLRLHQQTLQKLKIVNGCELGVQLLMEEEDLRDNQLLLNVCLRSENERGYADSKELIWDLSQGASVAQLCRAVSNFYQLPEQNLRLAKHNKDRFEWIVLTEIATAAPKASEMTGKRKKKNVTRCDIRHSPYNLQDGDVIGAKIVSDGEQPSKDDFATTEDDLGQERLRKEADEERKRKEERRTTFAFGGDDETGTSRRRGRTEAAIRIHVDNFS